MCHHPFTNAACIKSHFEINPAVPGAQNKLSPPTTIAAAVKGIDLPNPAILS